MNRYLVKAWGLVAFAVALVLGQAGELFAQGITLPDIGVSVPDHIEAAGTEWGTVLLALFGLFLTCLLIYKGFRWIKRVV